MAGNLLLLGEIGQTLHGAICFGHNQITAVTCNLYRRCLQTLTASYPLVMKLLGDANWK